MVERRSQPTYPLNREGTLVLQGWRVQCEHLDSLLEAGEFLRILQNRQEVQIASLDEIAFQNSWIDRSQLIQRGRLFEKIAYGRALLHVAEGR